MGGRALLGHAPGHAHPPAVAAEELPIGKTRGFGNGLHPPGDLRFRQPEHLLMAANTVGAIVSAIHRTAQRAQPAVAASLDRIRASPVVHADETGWRQSGANGYVWTFSTPTERYFLRRGRGKAVVDEALGESFSGVLVSDFYAAYHHYDGPKQRCWAHLLRDIHDLVALYPKDTALAQWAAAVHQLYVEARSMSRPGLSPILRHSDGVSPNWPGSGSCWSSASPSWLTR